MEHEVLVAPRVQGEFRRFELGSLYTDGGTPDEDANLKTQIDTFGSSVIPAYYLVDPATGKVIAGHVGVTTEEKFLEFLSKG
jgi:hypothetical protein